MLPFALDLAGVGVCHSGDLEPVLGQRAPRLTLPLAHALSENLRRGRLSHTHVDGPPRGEPLRLNERLKARDRRPQHVLAGVTDLPPLRRHATPQLPIPDAPKYPGSEEPPVVRGAKERRRSFPVAAVAMVRGRHQVIQPLEVRELVGRRVKGEHRQRPWLGHSRSPRSLGRVRHEALQLRQLLVTAESAVHGEGAGQELEPPTLPAGAGRAHHLSLGPQLRHHALVAAIEAYPVIEGRLRRPLVALHAEKHAPARVHRPVGGGGQVHEGVVYRAVLHRRHPGVERVDPAAGRRVNSCTHARSLPLAPAAHPRGRSPVDVAESVVVRAVRRPARSPLWRRRRLPIAEGDVAHGGLLR